MRNGPFPVIGHHTDSDFLREQEAIRAFPLHGVLVTGLALPVALGVVSVAPDSGAHLDFSLASWTTTIRNDGPVHGESGRIGHEGSENNHADWGKK